MGAECAKGVVALSDVTAEAPTSGGRGPRYLLVTCYAVGGLVGAVVLALLVVLAVDGHPLPLLAAAVGALLPVPLRGIAYLLGVPRPVRGRVLDTSPSTEDRFRELLIVQLRESLHDHVQVDIGHRKHLRVQFWLRILALPNIWYWRLLLRLQGIFRPSQAPGAGGASVTPAPSDARAESGIQADISAALARARRINTDISRQLGTTDALNLFKVRVLTRDLIDTLAAMSKVRPDLGAGLTLAIELEREIDRVGELDRKHHIPRTDSQVVALQKAQWLAGRLEQQLKAATLSTGSIDGDSEE